MTGAGSISLDGAQLSVDDGDGGEWSYTGTSVGTASPPHGSIWVEGDSLHFVTSHPSGRRIEYELSGTVHESEPGIPGSIWIERGSLAFLGESGRKVVVGGDDDGGSDLALSADGLDLESTTVTAGDTVEVTARYTNEGAAGTETAMLYLGSQSVDETSFSVDAGESGSVTLSGRTTSEDVGQPGVVVDFESGGAARSDLYVEEDTTPPGDFTITSFTAEPERVAVGDSVTLSVEAKNSGGEQTVHSVLDIGDRNVVDTEFTLSGGDTGGGSEPFTVREGDLGTEQATWTLEGAGVSATTPLEVVEAGSDLSLSLDGVRSPVTHATTELDVPATVTNDRVDAATVEVAAAAGSGQTTETVEVAAGETASVVPTVPVDADPSGNLSVSIEAVTSSGDSVGSASATVGVVDALDVTIGDNDPSPGGSDGLYRDIDGDGSVGQGDVAAFFNYQHREELKQPAYFDFSGNGQVSHGDVKALADYVALNST